MISAADLGKQISTIEHAISKAENGDKAEQDRAIGALKSLLSEKITVELLTETQVGKTVRKFSKSSCKPVADAAKSLLDCWKDHVKQAASAKDTPAAPKQEKEKKEEAKPAAEPARGKQVPADPPAGPSAPVKHELKVTGDEKRDRYINTVADILAMEMHRVEGADAGRAATEVEAAVAKRYNANSKDYMSKFRTLTFNLKDKDNWELRAKVLLGEITATELVTMPEEQLASNRVKEEMERLHKEVLEKSVIHENATGQRTAMYECGKCKKRDCTFYEKQTRSADEPMTVFITCVNCGNKWRMN